MAAPTEALRGAEVVLLLEKLPLDSAEKLLNELGASLSGKKHKEPQQNQYAELSASDFQKSTQVLSEIFRNHCLSPGSGPTDLLIPSNLSTPYKEKIRQSLIRHETDLRAYLQRVDNIPRKVLKTFDWQALVVAASSQLSSQETPILRLSLDFEFYSGSQDAKPTSIELTVPELDSTISELQACLGV